MAFVSLLIFSVTVLNTDYCQSPSPTNPYVYVLVWRYYNPNDPLSSAISTYKQDLEKAGFSVELKFRPYLPANAEGIRELLQNEALKHEIAGVLMVGDVPIAKYEMEIKGWNYTFPCDLYYMDLDGSWTDSDGNGAYDGHSGGEGDLGPEIWIGRLYASTMTGDEDELLINYFDKNHRFRTGNLTLPRRAIAYIDDDFANWTSFVDMVNSSLRMIYGNETTLAIDPEITSVAHYKNTLNDTLGYEWLLLVAHGNYESHAFRDDPWEYVNSSEIRSIDPHVFFYNMMACGTADYTCWNFSFSDYIGGSYLFADTYGLLVVGSTKVHYLWDVTDFYEPIAKGKCIGQAFKEWFEKNGELNRITSYGLTILGDPALSTPRTYNQTRNVAITNVTVGATEVYSDFNVTIKVTIKNEGVFVETVNVTVCYNDNVIEMQTVSLLPASDRILTFVWDTTGIRSGNYTIKAEASTLPQELDTADNTLVDGTIKVKKICDVNGDGRIGIADVILTFLNWGTVPPKDPTYDVNRDGTVNIADVIIIFLNWG